MISFHQIFPWQYRSKVKFTIFWSQSI
jgi:hypothetical protein